MSENAETRMGILQLLSEGKITVDEAGQMLAGSNPSEESHAADPLKEEIAEKEPPDIDDLIKVEPDPALPYTKGEKAARPSWLRVRVSDMKTGKNKVTVNVPMRLVRFGLAIGSRFSPELNELNWDEIDGFLTTEKGMLVDVQDEEDGEHVQIFVD